MKKRILPLILALSLIGGTFAGCGKSAQTQTPASTSDSNKVVELTFWHAMGGAGGDAINKLVDNFNNSQKKIHVTAQFQGTYDDAINKLKSAMQGNAGPDVVQIYDIGTRFMIDSGYIVPMQNFIDSEKYDTSSLEPNLLAYYSVGNKLYSMPFNSSTPILYYNKTAFKAAGLDPNKPPKTFSEIEEDAKALTKKDGSGKVTQYGFSMAIYGWFFEQLVGKQGFMYTNNGNGRTGKATAVDFDKNDAGLNVMKEWEKLYESGNMGNFGRKTADTQNAFIAGRTAMILESTATLKSLMNGVAGRFDIGTAYLPSLTDSDKGGVSIGGASLWAIDNKSDERKKAAWEFIKFMVSPEQQVIWNQGTGYFPVTKKSYDLPDMKANLEKYPQFQTAIDQLHATSPDWCGALLGVFPEARAQVETNIEKMLQKKQTPDQAVTESAKAINSALANYNNTNK